MKKKDADQLPLEFVINCWARDLEKFIKVIERKQKEKKNDKK